MHAQRLVRALCTPRGAGVVHRGGQSYVHGVHTDATQALADALWQYKEPYEMRQDVQQQAQQYARWILEEARARHTAPEAVQNSVQGMIQRVAQGEPLAYVLGACLSHPGHQPFGTLSIRVRSPVLIPRPETEEWVLHVAEILRHTLAEPGPCLRILDLCTGSGCIALLLAHELRGSRRPWHITALDCDECAISLAQENATLHSLPVDVVRGDLLDPQDPYLNRHYDVVVCNPPYIVEDDYKTLPHSVRSYEAHGALVGHAEGDGLAYYRRLAGWVERGLLRASSVSPQLVMEVGLGQSADVLRLFNAPGKVWHDFAGHDRVVAVSWPRTSLRSHHVP